MSKRSVFSTVTSGSRISCWCSLFGKYSSSDLPLSRNAPDPGISRTRTTASLRRPTVGEDGREPGQRDAVGGALGVELVGGVGDLGGLCVDRGLLDGLDLGLGGGHGLSLFWCGRVWRGHWATWVISNAAGF